MVMERYGTIKVNGIEHDIFDLGIFHYPKSEQLLEKVHELARLGCMVKSVYKNKGEGYQSRLGLVLICPQSSKIKEVKI